jgi:hypothetical protein
MKHPTHIINLFERFTYGAIFAHCLSDIIVFCKYEIVFIPYSEYIIN